MSIFKVHEAYHDLKRSGQIFKVLAKYGFGDLLDRFRARYPIRWIEKMLRKEREELVRLSTPERVRLAFEELGPTFIKLGQILSVRPDLLPPEFIREFTKFQDRVPPFPFEEAKEIVESQVGQSLSELFESFEEKPLAAAFLAQVHPAKTLAGEEVAVKVQRPRIESIIEKDIRILYHLARLAERHLPEMQNYEPVRIVDEFAWTIRRELDFIREGRNIDRFRKHFAGDETVYIPKVYRQLTASRVLTMEHIRGIKISELEVLKAAGLDPTRQFKELIKVLGEAGTLLKKFPSNVQEILSKLRNDELGIRFEHRGLEHFISEMDRSSNRISFAVVIAALIIGSSLVMQLGKGPLLWGLPLLGLIGYLVTALFGLWLVIGIL